MARGRRKKVAARKKDEIDDDSFTLRNRRSSMRVNLSYVSTLSDSEHGSLKRASNSGDEDACEESLSSISAKKSKIDGSKASNDTTTTPASTADITVINKGSCPNNDKAPEDEIQNSSLLIIKEKEQRLNKSCMQLKDAIMYKTQTLFDKENELAIKTTEVLATGYTSCTNNISEIDEINDKRSPSIKVNIGKNDQIIMSGDGKKRNPVQVNSMLQCDSPGPESNASSQKTNDDCMDNQSIVSTPKKSRIEDHNSKEELSGKASETMLRIPVARLFTNDNDPNDSMSEVNALEPVNSSKSTGHDTSKNSVSNDSNSSITLNYSASPILSQGTRRSRISRLSLKKKLSLSLKQTSSKISSTTTNESFANVVPLTCSSFIEKQNKTTEDQANQNKSDKNCDTSNVNKKSKLLNNTINLDDNSSSNKTVNIDTSSSQSCMEITTISSHMPIIHRPFQTAIRKSLNLDSVVVQGLTQNNNNTSVNKKISPIVTDQSKSPNKNVDSESSGQMSNDVCQTDSSANTVRTSLNVNTSLDRINSADSSVQKENEIPNKSKESMSKKTKQVEEDDDLIMNPLQSACTIRSSMQVNTSLDSVISKYKYKKKLGKNKRTSIRQSNDLIKNQEPNDKISSIQSSNNVNQEKENNDGRLSSRPSTSTVRSSMQVNTSLDSARKSPITKNVLDFNKILSMVQETSSNENESVYSTKDQSSGSDSDLENMSLMERIRNISASRKTVKNNNMNPVVNIKKISNIDKRSKSNAKSSIGSKSNEIETSSSTIKLIRNRSTRSSTTKKADDIENISSNTNESSVVEATPYPTSRSVLIKTMIKNNIAMNTLDPRKFIDLSDDEESDKELKSKESVPSPNKYKSIYARKKSPTPSLTDTVVINSSDESSDETDTRKKSIIIEESLNETKEQNKSKNKNNADEEQKNKKSNKRKLYALRENSQLVSFSPSDIHEPPKDMEPKNTKKRKTQKATQKKKVEKEILSKDLEPVNESVSLDPEPSDISDPLTNEILHKKIKSKKKPRKITSKKIVVKKVTNTTILDNMMRNEGRTSQRLSDRNSLREFDLRRAKFQRTTTFRKNHKIIIVITGLPKEDRELVKSVIKGLGLATLESNVSPRTTHVVSSGVRTINLLKGIIRGCWLLTLEWALKSLEKGTWLDPSPYEMIHFSKAVQENRRDRQLFGKAYVPELFVTCGFIYIENGTTPPCSSLKELVKIAGGRITEDPQVAEIFIGSEGLKESWILDSITTGEIQPFEQYKRN